jgi:cyclophilin family peptidyl-prolyl cis-trans isomerase
MHESHARGGIAPALLCLLLAACEPGEAPGPRATTAPGQPQMAVIRMELGGEIHIRFLRDKAPKHVENFKKLAREGYYDGTTFHRVIPGFMIQGGDHLSKDADPRNDGTGTPGYFVDAEFNDVPHGRGTVAMGRRSGVDTAGSQFYIMVADSPRWRTVLDGKYTVFGEVVRGMEVADRIVTVLRDNRDRPHENQVMKSVTIVPLAKE